MPIDTSRTCAEILAELDARVTAASQPTLTLGGPLTFTIGDAAGTLVAMIGNVPAGATPTLTPNDGRLAIAGSEGAVWKVVVGLTASSEGEIALSVAAPGANGKTAIVTVAAAPLATYLPAITSASYAMVASPYRLVEGYNGPVATVCANGAPDTPTSTVDVYAKADGSPDLAAAVAAFGTSFDVWKAYDQQQLVPPAIQTIAARRPVITATRFGSFVGYYGGKNAGDLTLPQELTTQRRNGAQLAVVAGPNCANDRMALLSLGSADVAAMASTWTTQRGFKDRGDAEHDVYLAIDQQPCVVGVRLRGSGNVHYRGDQSYATAPYGAATMQGGSLGSFGDTSNVSGQSVGLARLGDVIFTADPSDADFAAVRAALASRFAIPQRQSQVVFIGSSIDCGLGQVPDGQIFPARNYQSFLADSGLPGGPMLINLARGGWRVGDFVNSWGGDGVLAQLKLAGANVLFIGGDTNGVQGGLTADQVIADRDTVIGWAKGQGYVVVVGTIIQRGSFDGGRNGVRDQVNARTRSEAAAKGYSVADFGDGQYNTMDGVHPTVAGYQAMAQVIEPVLEPALPA